LEATRGRLLHNREFLAAHAYAAFSIGACIWPNPEVHRSICGSISAVGDDDPIV
jgi:hypothetical protein